MGGSLATRTLRRLASLLDVDLNSPQSGAVLSYDGSGWVNGARIVSATDDPGVSDDADSGYTVGSIWVNTSSTAVFVSTDSSSGAAVWTEISGMSALEEYSLEVRLRHYEDLDNVDWHVQVEVAALGDPTFSSPHIQLDSSSEQTDLYYRLDELNAAGTVAAYPAGGINTSLSDVDETTRRAATVFWVPSTIPSWLERGKRYWVRYRQSSDDGSNWGDWTTEIVLV